MDRQEEVDFISAWGLARMMYVQMALRAAIELDVFDIISSSGPEAQLSCAQILNKLSTKNHDAGNSLERILRMLGVSSILSMSSQLSDDGQEVVVYGLTSMSHCLVKNDNGVSANPFILFHSEKEVIECLYSLKDSILSPESSPVYKSYHGQTLFEDASKKPQLSNAFNGGLLFLTEGMINRMLKLYKGFEGVYEVMDVGGNKGGTLAKIVSLYPHIRGINFDLPHVVSGAPQIPGVEFVGGDMFESLPKAQTIFLKFILHDWNDEQCIKILNNCREAMPENGKVIVAEFAVPEVLDNNVDSTIVATLDFIMLVQQDGKERKLTQYAALAKAAGFDETKAFPMGQGFHIIEFIKNSEA